MSAHIHFQASRHADTHIVVGRDLPADGLPVRAPRALFVVDERVQALHASLVNALASALTPDAALIAVRAGESAKTLEDVARLLGELAARGWRKDDWLVAVGGGSVTDLVAFTAQVLFRGVPCVLVPTTLVAQVDAAIGGKNGLNVDGRKNRIGSFYWPTWVFCDTRFLDTLDVRERRCGLAEMAKAFAVADGATFREIMAGGSAPPASEMVARAVATKLRLLEADPFETSPRRLLNFGHTFAHFLEEESRFTLKHGEAVLLSMLCEVIVGRLAGMCPEGVVDGFWRAIAPLLPDRVSRAWPSSDRMRQALEHVRAQRGGALHVVVLADIGSGAILDDVDVGLVDAAWNVVRARLEETWSQP